eukprot:gene26880-4489_t
MHTTSPEDSGDAIALKFYPDADAAEVWGWVVSCNEQLQVLYAGSTQVQWDVPQDLELVIPDVVTTLMAVSETDVTPALTTQCGCTPTISVESGISIWTGVKQWYEGENVPTTMEELIRCNPDMMMAEDNIIAGQELQGICIPAEPEEPKLSAKAEETNHSVIPGVPDSHQTPESSPRLLASRTPRDPDPSSVRCLA